MAESDWQMGSGFFHYIRQQDGISTPRTMKFCMEHPNKREQNTIVPRVLDQRGKLGVLNSYRSCFNAATVHYMKYGVWHALQPEKC
jgi:hypothetical protein